MTQETAKTAIDETREDPLMDHCLFCDRGFVPAAKGGNKKLFCSGTCRAKHSQSKQPRVSLEDYELLQRLKAKPEVLCLL